MLFFRFTFIFIFSLILSVRGQSWLQSTSAFTGAGMIMGQGAAHGASFSNPALLCDSLATDTSKRIFRFYSSIYQLFSLQELSAGKVELAMQPNEDWAMAVAVFGQGSRTLNYSQLQFAAAHQIQLVRLGATTTLHQWAGEAMETLFYGSLSVGGVFEYFPVFPIFMSARNLVLFQWDRVSNINPQRQISIGTNYQPIEKVNLLGELQAENLERFGMSLGIQYELAPYSSFSIGYNSMFTAFTAGLVLGKARYGGGIAAALQQTLGPIYQIDVSANP